MKFIAIFETMKQLLIAFLFFGLISTFSIGNANIPVAQNKDFVIQSDNGYTVADYVTTIQFAETNSLITLHRQADDFVFIETPGFEIDSGICSNFIGQDFSLKFNVNSTFPDYTIHRYLKRPGWQVNTKNIRFN